MITSLLFWYIKAITDEGQDPDEYLIVPCGGLCKVSPRKNSGMLFDIN